MLACLSHDDGKLNMIYIAGEVDATDGPVKSKNRPQNKAIYNTNNDDLIFMASIVYIILQENI